MTGRPTLCKPETIKRIADALRLGMPHRYAAERGGISEATFYEWKQRGATGEAPFAEFLEAVQKAENDFMLTALATIQQASRTTWQAGAWLLERRYPEEFGRREHRKIEVSGGLAGLSDAELEAQARKWVAEQGGGE